MQTHYYYTEIGTAKEHHVASFPAPYFQLYTRLSISCATLPPHTILSLGLKFIYPTYNFSLFSIDVRDIWDDPFLNESSSTRVDREPVCRVVGPSLHKLHTLYSGLYLEITSILFAKNIDGMVSHLHLSQVFRESFLIRVSHLPHGSINHSHCIVLHVLLVDCHTSRSSHVDWITLRMRIKPAFWAGRTPLLLVM